jgi:uncharacterized paraquat-inducible protein A
MSTTLWIVVIAGVPLVGLGAYLFWRSQQPRQEQAFEHFKCPHCKQRLRYLPKQAGNQGQCPRCKRSITFPR